MRADMPIVSGTFLSTRLMLEESLCIPSLAATTFLPPTADANAIIGQSANLLVLSAFLSFFFIFSICSSLSDWTQRMDTAATATDSPIVGEEEEASGGCDA